jgi:surface protein
MAPTYQYNGTNYAVMDSGTTHCAACNNPSQTSAYYSTDNDQYQCSACDAGTQLVDGFDYFGTGNFRCAIIAANGEFCNNFWQWSRSRACASGNYCKSVDAGGTGNCAATVADGENCNDSLGCSSGYCDMVTTTCAFSFQPAVDACLATHPVDGLCVDNEYGAMPGWDVSGVTDMSGAFRGRSAFNGDISAWDTSSVTYMYGMFDGASAFDQPLEGWNTSSVTSMGSMFSKATNFNRPLAAWDTSSVMSMYYMFGGASAFDQPLAAWNTASVMDTFRMFANASAFAQDITSWYTPKLLTARCTGANNNYLSAWAYTRPLFNST